MIASLKAWIRRRRLMLSGDHVTIGARADIYRAVLEGFNDIGADAMAHRVTIGRYSYLGPRAIVADARIGRFCSIAPEVIIGSGGHPVRRNVALHPAIYLRRPARGWSFVEADTHDEFATTWVGNDVWLGARSIVRDGVTVGDGVVLGAGAVAIRDLEPYGIYAGVPARLIRFRFDDALIARLLDLRWWDREPEWLRRHAVAFGDVDALLMELDREDS